MKLEKIAPYPLRSRAGMAGLLVPGPGPSPSVHPSPSGPVTHVTL